ncbi:hypothetical protein AB0I84_19890 [Streptomyces spectabilis]
MQDEFDIEPRFVTGPVPDQSEAQQALSWVRTVCSNCSSGCP